MKLNGEGMNSLVDGVLLANIHPETNIAYGYVAANDLDSDIVDSIFNAQTKDLDLEDHLANQLSSEDFEQWQKGITTDEVDAVIDEYHMYDNENPLYEAKYMGVELRSSYLGGSLHFFILKSPHITEVAEKASPCVPNAGILKKDMDGSTQAYSIPEDWWSEYN